MPEKIEELVRAALAAAQEAGDLSAFELDDCAIERPADTSHGEWTSTMALKSAKLAHCAPRKIAEAVVAHMPEDPAIEKVEIAGPGFINFYLSVAVKNAIFGEAREKGMDFAKSNVGGGLKTQVEFVSANPTGPMHIGHGRWAALGDSLCRVMDHAGYDIQREFYINDHGSQMNTFGNSISTRYMQLADIIAKQGVDIDEAHKLLIADRDAFVADENDEHPETHPYQDNFAETLGKDSYGGDYIIDEAAEFWRTDGDKWVEADPQERMESFRERGYVKMVDNMRDLCHAVNCDFDRWYSERSLYVKDTEGETAGTSAVDRAFEKLDKMGYLYTKDGALWFRSTDLGDDKDRVIIKSNGDFAYFAADIAYYWNKRHRAVDPADVAIYMLGADHHGYIGRMMAMCAAFGDEPGVNMQILIGQLVNVMKNGKPVRMSKRAGNVVTIDDLVEAVGVDAARYSLARTDYNTSVDIDLDLLTSHSNENPVYYVQYAHARSCNVDRNAAAAGIGTEGADLSLLDTEADGEVLAALAQWPATLALAGDQRAPHKVAHYLEDLAGAYHKWYNVERVVPMALTDPEERLDDAAREALRIAKNPEPARAAARLKLNDAVRTVIASGLDLLGVTAPDKM